MNIATEDAPFDSPQVIATNTLLVTNLTDQDSFSEHSLVTLEQALSAYGRIARFIPLRTLARCMVIFVSTLSAMNAREALNEKLFMNNYIKVYFGQKIIRQKHHDMDSLQGPNSNSYLRVPEQEKNFLLSPPGSPPLDWRQERESAPFTGGHLAVFDDFSLGSMSLDNNSISQVKLKDPKAIEMEDTLEQTMERLVKESSSEDKTRIVLSFSKSPRPPIRPSQENQPMTLSNASSIESFAVESSVDSCESLPMIVVENVDGEALQTWGTSGLTMPTTALPKTSAPPCFFE